MTAPPAPRPPGRRLLVRSASLALLVGALCLPMVGGGEVEAFRGWCRADPEVQIAGQTAHVQLDLEVPNMHAAQQLGVGKPIAIVLTVPQGVDARLLAVDRGFGEGYDFTVQHSSNLKSTQQGIPVKVDAFIPMHENGLAVDVAFVPAGSASEQQAPGQATGQTGRSHGVGRLGGDGLAFASSPGTVNTWVSVLANH